MDIVTDNQRLLLYNGNCFHYNRRDLSITLSSSIRVPHFGVPKKSKWIGIFPTAFFLQKNKKKCQENFKNAQNVHPNPAEKVMSKLGQVLTKRRLAMSGELFYQIMFLIDTM